METNAITSANAVTVANASLPTKEEQSRTSLSSDLDTFLKLLTAQIENQDPLEPTDGTEYAAQLAQFSSVEQSVRTNELLAEIQQDFARQDLATAANWIGMEVRHTGAVALAGQPIRLFTDISPAADRAELVVLDETGEEVLRRPIDPDAETLDWSGGDGRGGTLPDGTYSVSVAAYGGAAELGTRPVAHYGTVNEVTLGATGTVLVLDSGLHLDIDDLESLRRAG